MRPSETSLGRHWIRGFAEPDRPLAQLLIDSLEIHDHVEIMTEIGKMLKKLAASDDDRLPILLVPIRSIEDISPFEVHDGISPHVAYQTFDPGASFPPLPGSEAEIGGLSRGLITMAPEIFLPPDSSVKDLIENKVRTICLITDYSGSGKQAAAYVDTFKRNPTIASWISYGYIRMNVLTYASSIQAAETFQHDKYVTFESSISAKSAVAADWSDSERTALIDLCQRYALPDDPNEALGYGGSFGLYLTNMRVPNNLPQILIRSGGSHPGLFAGRQYPSDLFTELRQYHPAPSLSRTLRNLGAEDLAEQLDEKTRPVRGLRALAALHLIDYGLAEEQIDAMLSSDPNEAKHVRATLIAMELLTLDGALTKRGKAELTRARTRAVTLPRYRHQAKPPVSYEPTQLR